MGTLMPHLAEGRHHLYRNVTGLMLLAALIAAGFGSLPVALVLAAVALPATVLVYIHDHRLWRTEPITLITVAFGLALALGIGVGLLETYFVDSVVAWGAPGYHLPPVSRILKLGVLVPVVAFAAVLIAPLLISTRSAFRHPMDVVVSCSLGGAALSLGLSVVVQHGAFTHVQATTGDPAHVAFIALTLGFLQPIVFATAAMVGVLGLRAPGVNTAVGVLEGVALVVAYELATTLLQPYGTRGIVLTALAAFVLAGAGMWLARNALHAATAADSAHAETAEEREGFEHRLHAAAVAAVVVVVVVAAAAISLAVAEGGNSTPPTPPGRGGGIAPGAAAAAGPLVPARGESGEKRSGDMHLASVTKPLALAFGPIDLGSGVSVAPAQGWTILNQDRQWVNLINAGHDAIVYASVGKANKQDVVSEANLLINQNIRSGGLTNVQQNSSARPTPLQGRNFQQLIELDYTADAQSNQGTMQIWGGWIVLFNSSTEMSAFFNYFASSQETFKSSLTDAAGMLSSME
jgi:hypothetical protein